MVDIHIKYITVMMFRQKVDLLKDQNLKNHLLNMVSLTAITWVNQDRDLGYDTGYFGKGATTNLDEAQKLLLRRIRPQIIPIVENLIPHSDNELMSAIGNSYGDIYETHLEWAKTSRFNQSEDGIPNGYEELILPIL